MLPGGVDSWVCFLVLCDLGLVSYPMSTVFSFVIGDGIVPTSQGYLEPRGHRHVAVS